MSTDTCHRIYAETFDAHEALSRQIIKLVGANKDAHSAAEHAMLDQLIEARQALRGALETYQAAINA